MDVHTIAPILFQTVKAAGVVARNLQADIQNEGKTIEREERESDAHFAMREAKTKVDELVQEMLLQSVYPYLGHMATLDVEEDTPSLRLYPKQNYAYTLIIDPIDGTLPYIQQADTYSICVALLQEHEPLIVIVYFPARDVCYSYVEDAGTMYYEQASLKTYEQGDKLTFPSQPPMPELLFKNARVPQALVEKMQDAGYEVIDDQVHGWNCPAAILACMRYEAMAYCCAKRNLRDVMLAMIMAKMQHGYAYDFKGNPILWNTHGRQAEIVVSGYDLTEFFTKLERN